MSDWRSRFEAQFEATIRPAVARSATISEIVVEAGALSQAPALHRQVHGEAPALLIADENTHAAAGRAVEAALRTAGVTVTTHILPARPRPKPTVEAADAIGAAMAAAGEGAGAVAVGSGVINDLVKYAAFRLGRPYLCVATAASMDGYASAGSPLSEQGFKKTIPCRPPVAILADLDVLGAAPSVMTAWGFGDLAGKIPAGADWIIADALGIEALDALAWPLVQDHLRDWLAGPEKVASGDAAAIAGLFTGLTATGLAMEIHGSSRPASGADHQIAHLWEMAGLTHFGEPVSHGACVSIGTLTVLGLYDWLLDQDLAAIDVEQVLAGAADLEAKRVEIERVFTQAAVAERALEETAAKHLSPEAHRDRLSRIVEVWPSLRDRLRAQLMSCDEMAALLEQAGAPVRASQIGLDPTRHRATAMAARFQRSRYTVFDLLDETGLLESAFEAVFSQPVFRAA